MAKTSAKTRFWLMKSEPDVFSYDDLERAPKKTTLWDGVRNYRARNFMRDDMKKGDGVLYYHSNAKPMGVAGVAKVVRESYPDPTQFDPKSKYYDAASTEEDPRWFLVDIQAVAKCESFVPLADMKANPKLAEMMVTQRGSRLSVQPVSPQEWREVLRMGGVPKVF